jgi:hypothetical protein
LLVADGCGRVVEGCDKRIADTHPVKLVCSVVGRVGPNG